MADVHRIVSGETPVAGLRVFTNDFVWGIIREPSQEGDCGRYCTAWHGVQLDTGPTRIYNCERLTTKEPT